MQPRPARSVVTSLSAAFAIVLAGATSSAWGAAPPWRSGTPANIAGPAAGPACGAFSSDPIPRPGHSQVFADVAAVPGTKAAWAVGTYHDNDTLTDRTLVERWTGAVWKQVASPSPGMKSYDNDYLLGVAALSANDAWAVGYRESTDGQHTLVEHWDGTRWRAVPSPDAARYNSLRSVAALAPSDVWAVGRFFDTNHDPVRQRTLAMHWDGDSWTIVKTPNRGARADNELVDVTTIPGTGRLVAVGFHYYDYPHPLVETWDGTSWSLQRAPHTGEHGGYLNGVSAASADDVWAAGFAIDRFGAFHLVAAHGDGSSWTPAPPLPPEAPGYDPMMNSVTAVSPTDVWAVGTYYNSASALLTLAEHWNGSAWTIVPTDNPGTEGMFAANVFIGVAAISPSDVRAVGYYHGPNDQFDPNHGMIQRWCP
jgi:hypothetical protein